MMINSEARTDQRARSAAREIMRILNNMSLDHKNVAWWLSADHRTLQQSLARVIDALLAEWASAAAEDRYDARNEATVMWAKEIKDKVSPLAAPFI